MANTTKDMNKHGDTRGLHPNSLKNLRPNLNGRPTKLISLTAQLKEDILKPVEGDKQHRTWLELLSQAWLRAALKNPAYFKELLERIEGRVTQPIAGEEGQPLRHIIQVVDQETKRALDDFIK